MSENNEDDYDGIMSGVRHVNTYAWLGKCAREMQILADKADDPSMYPDMSTLVFMAFTVEAYLNHLGSIKINYWDDIESISVRKKLNVLSSHLMLNPDYSCRPFQTLIDLFRFRNTLAHGKTHKLSMEAKKIKFDEDNMPKARDYMPNAKWEEYCTKVNVENALEDVKEVLNIFHQAAGYDRDPLDDYGMTLSGIAPKATITLDTKSDDNVKASDSSENTNAP